MKIIKIKKILLLILFSLLLINCSDNEDSVEQYTINENLNVYALGFADGSADIDIVWSLFKSLKLRILKIVINFFF